MHKKILEKEILKDGVLKNKNAKRKKQIKMNEKTLEKKKKKNPMRTLWGSPLTPLALPSLP